MRKVDKWNSVMPKTDRNHPSLEQLRYLVKTLEHKSLTAAATASGTAQSVFSRQLAGLEEAMGGRLLHRTGRGVEPTELGKKVLPHAQALLAQVEDLVQEARGRWNRPTGCVSVGIVPSLVRPLTSRLFSCIQQELPDVTLRIFEAYSGEIETMLAEGRIDIGIFNRYRARAPKGLDPIMTAAVCLVGAPEVVGSGRKSVRFSELAGRAFVMPHRPNTLRSTLDEIAARKGLALKVVLEVDSSAAIKDAVTHSALCTILPAHALAGELEVGRLVAHPLTHPGIHQATFLDTTRRRPASAAVREVEKKLKGLLAQAQLVSDPNLVTSP